MDELRYHYMLRNEEYHALLREAEHARLVARILRSRRRLEGVYPPWLARLLSRLSAALIATGQRLQDQLAKTGSLPPAAGEQQHQYSYGD